MHSGHAFSYNVVESKHFFDFKCIVADTACLLTVILPALVLVVTVEPTSRGFFCEDMSIHLPYHEETVSTKTAFLVAVMAPLSIFILVELQQYYSNNLKLRQCMVEVYDMSFVYLFGLGATSLITVLTKLLVGKQRPHFYQICNPKPQSWDYTLCAENNVRSIPEYVCFEKFKCEFNSSLNKSLEAWESAVKDAQMSFVSGHASSSTFMMVFMILYINCHLNTGRYRFLKPLIGQAFILNTLVTCITRITDNMHHPSDVLAGCALGGLVAGLIHVLYVHRDHDDQDCDRADGARGGDGAGATPKAITNHLSKKGSMPTTKITV